MSVYDLETASFVVDIVSSAATVVGLGVAVYAIIHQVSALRREQNERAIEQREREERRRRAQAAGLSARMDFSPLHTEVTRIVDGQAVRAPAWTGYVTVSNASQLPFYDIEVSVVDPWNPWDSDESAPPPRGGHLTILAGGQEDQIKIEGYWGDRRLDGEPVDVNFRDATGTLWERLRTGTLTDISDQVYPPSQYADDPH